MDVPAWAALSQLALDMTFPTEALGLVPFQRPQLLPPLLMLPKTSEVWPVQQPWRAQAGTKKMCCTFPRL